MKIGKILYSEFVAGHRLMDYLFLLVGVLLQVLVYWIHPEQPIVIVSGLAGVCSVVLCSQGKISSFVFGFVQVITYLIISYEQKLYAEVAINVFYFVSMVYGVWAWRRQYGKDTNTEETAVRTRRLSGKMIVGLFVILALLSWIVGWCLARFTDDSQPYLDAFTTVPAIAAQMLMVLRYRDQWYYWLLIDVAAAVMWYRADNYSMMTLYLFWCLNCVYGFVHWSQNRRSESI